LTLAPPSGYALNLKALIKVSKVSWRSQLSYEILRSSFERKFDKTNFPPPKSPHRLGLISALITNFLTAIWDYSVVKTGIEFWETNSLKY
jgi:hypothetical protein